MADWSRMVHGIGDLHAGYVKPERVATMLKDVDRLSTPVLHLQIGDATEHGLGKQDTVAKRWFDRLPAPHYTILGNHDVMGVKGKGGRTAAEWAKVYGYKSPNYLIDLPFVRIIAVAPDRGPSGKGTWTLSRATLEWLELRLKRAGRDCWIACHWPLKDTVLGPEKTVYRSDDPKFYAKPDSRIRALLARNPNAKVWISGHTHSPLSAPGLITRKRLPNRRSIIAINLSAIAYVGKKGRKRQAQDPVCSLYLTHLPGKVEIRFRDHGARRWTTVGGQRVVSVRV